MKPTRTAAAAVLALATLLFTSPTLTRAEGPPVAHPKPVTDRTVVLISIDGLAAYYLDDPHADMPTLRALAKQGARATGMRAATPTVTWPNHTTLVTGAEPAHHGVVGNNYLDRATGKTVTLIADPVFDKAQIVKVPTIYDAAHDAGLKTAAIRWPASRNAASLDWTIPDTGASLELLNKYSTPGLLSEFRSAGITADPNPDGAASRAANAPAGTKVESRDRTFTRAFDLVLHDHRPNLALLHIADVDHTEHLHGPKSRQAYAAVHEADACVGVVLDELKKDFPDHWTLIVVSDHGFSPIQNAVLPNVLLRKAGLIDVKGLRVTSGNVRLLFQGGCAMVYLTAADDAGRAALAQKVADALKGAKGISKIIPPDRTKDYGVGDPKLDPHAPDMLLFAEEGWVFGDTAAGELPFREKPERNGSHGHDPDLPDLHATFVAAGSGIRPHVNLGEIRNTDVAPTIAKLLNLPLPTADGRPLNKALAD